MDLVPVDPQFNLYDQDWPIRTDQRQFSPATFIFAQDYDGGCMGAPLDSIMCGGCLVSWAHVQNSVLLPYVRVLDHADVHESILIENENIRTYSRIVGLLSTRTLRFLRTWKSTTSGTTMPENLP